MLTEIKIRIRAAWNCLLGRPTILKVTFLQGIVLDADASKHLQISNVAINNSYKKPIEAGITYAYDEER